MEQSFRVIGFLGKMCQQCAMCKGHAEKAITQGAIGEEFLKFEDYFAKSLARDYLPLESEYHQFQRFFEEASEACFDHCNGKEALIHDYATRLIHSTSCKTIADVDIEKTCKKVSKLSDFPRK